MIHIGVDVQIARGVARAAIDDERGSIRAGVLPLKPPEEVAASLLAVNQPLTASVPLQVGIDAPRLPLPPLRIRCDVGRGTSRVNTD